MRSIPRTGGAYTASRGTRGGRDIHTAAGDLLGNVERSGDPREPWMVVSVNLTEVRFRTLADAAESLDGLAQQAARRAARAI